MKIALKYFTPETFTEYDIHDIAHNGYVNREIRKGIYGLKEAGILVLNYIVNNLAPFGYHPTKHTLCLWKHEIRPITFTLYVEDFGSKSYSKEDKENLLDALKTKHETSSDSKGETTSA